MLNSTQSINQLIYQTLLILPLPPNRVCPLPGETKDSCTVGDVKQYTINQASKVGFFGVIHRTDYTINRCTISGSIYRAEAVHNKVKL